MNLAPIDAFIKFIENFYMDLWNQILDEANEVVIRPPEEEFLPPLFRPNTTILDSKLLEDEVIDCGKYIRCPDLNPEQLKEIERRVYKAYNRLLSKL